MYCNLMTSLHVRLYISIPCTEYMRIRLGWWGLLWRGLDVGLGGLGVDCAWQQGVKDCIKIE